MQHSTLPELERGDLPQITKLTKLRKLNEGRGYSYAYVKACFDPNNPRWNDEVIGIGWELIEARAKSMALLAQVRTTKRRKH